MEIKTHLRQLSEGSVGNIVGYDCTYGGYIGKLLAMGLTPGTNFVVLETAFSDGSIEIMLPEKIIKLSKPEANALCVEEADNLD